MRAVATARDGQPESAAKKVVAISLSVIDRQELERRQGAVERARQDRFGAVPGLRDRMRDFLLMTAFHGSIIWLYEAGCFLLCGTDPR